MTVSTARNEVKPSYVSQIPEKKSKQETSLFSQPRAVKPAGGRLSDPVCSESDFMRIADLLAREPLDLSNGLQIELVPKRDGFAHGLLVKYGETIYADLGLCQKGMQVKVLCAEGVRARGLPKAEKESGYQWRVWKIAQGEVDERAEAIVSYIRRTIQADRA